MKEVQIPIVGKRPFAAVSINVSNKKYANLNRILGAEG